jgi:CheY-like chemotaxis protein
MEASVIAKIFDPFFSTKEHGKGTGLGLAIVHGIVKNHHGFIDVKSGPNEGATFTLYFPAAPHSAEMELRETIPVPNHPGKTILLVDDEKFIREMLVEFLEDCGYTVMPSANGAEALRLYEKHHHLIDLVITDLGMPEMGGEELYRRLRQLDENVKVIVSSGYLDGSTKTDLMDIGVKDVLTKPYKFEEIQRVIQEVLQGGTSS